MKNKERLAPGSGNQNATESIINNIDFSDIKTIPDTLPGCWGEYNNQYFGKCIDCSVHLQCARTSMKGD